VSYSNDLETKVMNHLFGLASWTAPSGLFVSLHTADPGETGASEVSGNGYARVSAGIGASNWTITAQTVTNDNALTFTGPTPAAWGTITHFGISDASVAGNFVGGAALTSSRSSVINVDLSFAASALTATLD